MNQIRHYDLRWIAYRPEVGDVVYRKNHQLSNVAEGVAAKIIQKYNALYIISLIHSQVIVELQDEDGRPTGIALVKYFILS